MSSHLTSLAHIHNPTHIKAIGKKRLSSIFVLDCNTDRLLFLSLELLGHPTVGEGRTASKAGTYTRFLLTAPRQRGGENSIGGTAEKSYESNEVELHCVIVVCWCCFLIVIVCFLIVIVLYWFVILFVFGFYEHIIFILSFLVLRFWSEVV